MTQKIITVAELNRLAKTTLESGIPLLWVGGEVSNLVVAASGHVYFTLKDAHAAVRCVMFRSRAQLIGWRLQNGDKVEANARVTLYEARGDFQLGIENLRRAGSGNLFEAFLRLKEKLEREGLFDPAIKRPLPIFPRTIGIVTSPQAAALRDVVTTFARRAPHVALVLYPTPVQGVDAPAGIVAAIEAANRRVTTDRCELLVLCRGGGSIEDLWSFNDETVARAIRASALPIISGVGHETDFTIADFAADLRAPTPTAAAEQAAPAREALQLQLDDHAGTLRDAIDDQLAHRRHALEILGRRLRHPADRLRQHRSEARLLQERLGRSLREMLAERRTTLHHLQTRLARRRPEPALLASHLANSRKTLAYAASQSVTQRRAQLDTLAARLNALDPTAVLARGYAIVTASNGSIVKNSSNVELGGQINVRLAHGHLKASVTEKDAPPESV